MRYSIIQLIIGLIFVVAACGSPEQPRKSEALDPAQQLANNALALLQQGKLEQLVMLFHFPTSYTADELAKDRSNVQTSLSVLDSEFGKATEVEPLTGSAVYYHLSVAGANVPYWKTHSAFTTFKYSAHFGKVGSGYLVLEVCKYSDKYEIRFIHFGIPSWQPLAKEKLGIILTKMLAKRGG